MHKFDKDFYGRNLRISVVGYLRGEKNFDSLESLIAAIKQDIDNADKKLDSTEAVELKKHSFFNQQSSSWKALLVNCTISAIVKEKAVFALLISLHYKSGTLVLYNIKITSAMSPGHRYVTWLAFSLVHNCL